jgi:large subunit ribosomal protein L25
MELQHLDVNPREAAGSNEAGRERLRGNIPVVLYGGEGDAISLMVNRKSFEQILHGPAGEHAVLQLVVTGNTDLNTPAIVKAIQHHPIKGWITHADLMRIRLDVKIQTFVPIILVGRPQGVAEGGLMDQQLRELEIECLALEVPEQLEVDVTHLAIGDSLHVSDLTVPDQLTVITESDRAVAAVLAPRLATEEEGGEPAAEEEVVAAEGEGE